MTQMRPDSRSRRQRAATMKRAAQPHGGFFRGDAASGVHPILEIGFGALCIAFILSFIGFVIDAPLTRLARDVDPATSAALTDVAAVFSADNVLLASGFVCFLTCALSFAAKRPRARAAWVILSQRAAFVFLTVSLAAITVQLLKFGVGRSSPQFIDQFGAFNFRGFISDSLDTSFPSGHAAAAFASATAFALFAPRFSIFFLVLAMAIGALRVVSGAHYPSDVLGGMVLGVVLAIGYARVLARLGHVFRLSNNFLVRRGEGLISGILRGSSNKRRDAKRSKFGDAHQANELPLL